MPSKNDQQQMPTLEELNAGFDLGEWEVLPSQGKLRRGDEEITPEPKVFQVLLALAQRDGDLVTHNEFIDEVWEGRAFGDQPLQRCITILRGHLGDKRPYEYIETLQRRGYRLLKSVELHAPAAAPDPVVPEPTPKRPWPMLILAAALVIVVVVAIWPKTESPVELTRTGDGECSLAILPFDNLSKDTSNAYIGEGMRKTLQVALAELSDCTIKNLRNAMQGEPAEIAAQLGVGMVLFGSFQLHGDELMLHYEIVAGRDGALLKAGDLAGDLAELFSLQGRFAEQVRGELAGPKTPELITRKEPDSVAYNSFMRGRYALEHRFERSNLEDSIELFQESIRLDESYGPAYLGLATAYALLPDYRGADLDTHLNLALATIEEGIAKDPSIDGPADAIYGFVHYQRKEWADAERRYRRAVSAPVVDSNAFSWFSQMLANVGRMVDSRDIALAGEVIYPDSTVINSRIAMVYTWLDNTVKAHDYFARASDLDATGIIHEMAHALLLARGGQAELSRNLTYEAATEIDSPTDWIDPVYRGLADPEYAAEGLAAIDRVWQDGEVIPHIVILVRTLLGDIDGAMEIAWLLEEPGETFSMEILFIDELAPLRQHEDFMPLLDSLGVLEYWAGAGCTWADDRLNCES